MNRAKLVDRRLGFGAQALERFVVSSIGVGSSGVPRSGDLGIVLGLDDLELVGVLGFESLPVSEIQHDRKEEQEGWDAQQARRVEPGEP